MDNRFDPSAAQSTSKGILIYIHGYNTTFEYGLMKAAQLAWDTRYPGLPIAYSWASEGVLMGYAKDKETATLSAGHFADYVRLWQGNRSEPIDVVAEGLGAAVVLNSVSSLLTPMNIAGESKKLFGQLIFVVPDVDANAFVMGVRRLTDLAERITVFVDPDSKIMRASALINGSPRAGADAKTVASVREIYTVLIQDSEGFQHTTFISRLSLLDGISAVLRRLPMPWNPSLKHRDDNVWESMN